MYDGETSIWTTSSYHKAVTTQHGVLEYGFDLCKRASEDKILLCYVY